MTPELRHYLGMLTEQRARIVACRYLLDQSGDAEELGLVADCLRLLSVTDDELRQAYADTTEEEGE